jgi:cysteine-rich repeat protein
MRKFLFLIIGVIAFISTAISAEASFCNPEQPPISIYGNVYCGLSVGNENEESEIFEKLAAQLQYDAGGKGADLIKLIVDNGSNISCEKIKEFMKEKGVAGEKMPSDIKKACIIAADEAVSSTQSAEMWGIIMDNVYKAYEKERVLFYTKKNLNYEFKISEKYWDGELRDFGDAPFDLVVDLNLIEIVLFGSQAQWMSDVWKFPTDEGGGGGEEGGGAKPPSEQPSAQPSAQPSEQPSDQSVTTEVTVTPGQEGDCVPGDDPGADTGDHPGSDYTKPSCGDGKVDILLGEECDDGNINTGDGCNQYCMIEQTGATGMCQDPEAVTFSKPPSEPPSGQQSEPPSEPPSGQQSAPQPECPPGTFPKTETTITGPPPETPEYPEAPQSENYPGPDVGGTLKEFPESKKPPCKDGYSPVTLTTAGEETKTVCMPDSFLCADPNDTRDALFPGWENDEELAKIAETLEATFCVKVVKGNRAEAPYSMNEGCIDCHITAMAQALDKALETNVSPLENTTGGFAISSRWGPKFSFNLTTGVKSSFKMVQKAVVSEIEKLQENLDKTKKDNEPANTQLKPEKTLEQTIRDSQAEAEAQSEAVLSDLKTYRNASQVVSDQELYSSIAPLFDQMFKIFQDMQGQYFYITKTTQLGKKKTCNF